MRFPTLLLVLLAFALVPVATAGAQSPTGEPTTLDLIDAAAGADDITDERAIALGVDAVLNPERVPERYASDAPFRGTLPLLEALRTLPTLEGARRERLEDEVALGRRATTRCSSSTDPAIRTIESAHFVVEVVDEPVGTTAEEYVASLERAYAAQVSAFRWAAAPDADYLVRIDGSLAPTLYGFVAATDYDNLNDPDTIGNNPNTTWDDFDALDSCMALNANMPGAVSTTQSALDATTAHEYNHSIQYGYGALFAGAIGQSKAETVFAEGGATWMEDEVADTANDNYNYLYPNFAESMGEFKTNNTDPDSPYPYWFVFRGLTERYGTGVAGGGEDVMQRFWETTSRNTHDNLTAMQAGLAPEGTTLAEAFHQQSIGARFVKDCATGLAPPLCYEEAAGYRAAAGRPPVQPMTVATVGGEFTGTVEDAYAANFVALPEGTTPYVVSLTNSSTGGLLRATAACEVDDALRTTALSSVAGTGATATATFDPVDCARPTLIITNEAQPSANPSATTPRSYTASTRGAGPPVPLTVSRSGDGTVTSSPAGISCGTDCDEPYTSGTTVTLAATPGPGQQFTGWGGACSGTGACQVDMDAAQTVTASFAAAPAPVTPPGTTTTPPAAATTTTTPPPTTTPAPAPAPGSDLTAPRLASSRVLDRLLARVTRKGLRVSFTSDEPGRARATLTVDRATAKRLGLRRRGARVTVVRRTVTAAAGRRTVVTLRLSRSVTRRLRSLRRLTARVDLRVTDAAGNATKRRLAVRLR